jgi:hypothetical protein
MHPTPSALPKRALCGLGGLLLGSLLLLGPGQVSADHDLTCHPKPVSHSGGFFALSDGSVRFFVLMDQIDLDDPGPLVISAIPRDDRTGEDAESRTRTLQDPSDQDGPTTPVSRLVGAPAAARAC